MLKNPCSLPLLAICSVWASKVSLSSWRSDWLSSRWSGWPPSWWSRWLSSPSWCSRTPFVCCSRTPGCWLSSWPLLWCDFVTLQCSLPHCAQCKVPQLCHNNTLRPQHHLTGWWSRRSKVLESKSAPCWFKPSVINRRLQFFHFYKCLLYMCASPSYSMCQTLYAVYMGKKYLKVRTTM